MNAAQTIRTVPTNTGGWLMRFRACTQPRARLVCFHYAGGNASVFRDWDKVLYGDIELLAAQLPGHGWRRKEPLLTDARALALPVWRELQAYLDRPLILFGHSMGALLAYECACLLRASHGSLPVHLIVSARKAPHVAPTERPTYSLPHRLFIDKLREYGGTPEEILNDPALMEITLPVLRADFMVSDAYQHTVREKLNGPITVFGGSDDRLVPAECLRDWQSLTDGAFRMQLFAGAHFFLVDRMRELVAQINDIAGQRASVTDRTIP